ncbi:glycosyltransferase family 4 protein [Gottfriedia acidiceleris]|uniref:Glycosyltransferase family 4 protein n=1 Tax=Gottfriedia acidiceleris TaxID=371036 RepID=A0ABY4JKG3_9BACI|nr:glycosyltransferase family 4 protein [Gottfriedia acidiceleris]UPM53318.1 glycosyltransferase family 4 protein [Gottfriedia acidiceleris]
MKILMVCTENLPVPPVLGGAIQTYIAGSLPYLSKAHDITVLGVNDPSLPDEETIDGVNYVRVPGKVLELYREGVVEYIKGNQFDLIHIFNRPRLVLPIRKVAPNSKITLSMHNDMFNIGKIAVDEANLVLEEVSSIVTVSDYVGNVIRELYPQSANKIRTIYSGVDSDRFLPGNDPKMISTRNTLRKEYGLENKTVILFAGRLSENKGVDRLIRALPTLSKTFKDLALVIVGSNWFSQNNVTDYVAYIRAIAKKQDVPIITTGFVSPFEIHNWFAVADLFVCTSLWQEPLARVHYEAMAAGLPIVTTARGGNPEVIIPGENGLIVENPVDPDEFATKITEILSNKTLMKNMGIKGRELAVTKYLWSRVANEILSTWSQTEYASSISSEQLEQYEPQTLFRTAVQNTQLNVANNNVTEVSEQPTTEILEVIEPTVEIKPTIEIEQATESIVEVPKPVTQSEIKSIEELLQILVEKAKSVPKEKVVAKVAEEFSANTNQRVLKRIRRVTDLDVNNANSISNLNQRLFTNEVSRVENRANNLSNSVNSEPFRLKKLPSVTEMHRNRTR